VGKPKGAGDKERAARLGRYFKTPFKAFKQGLGYVNYYAYLYTMETITIQEKIKIEVTEAYHMTSEDVDKLQLPRLLSLIEMKNKVKYQGFCMELRKEGWII